MWLILDMAGSESDVALAQHVLHVHKEGKWVLYNDRKVAASETPPLDLGYMYVYRRKD